MKHNKLGPGVGGDDEAAAAIERQLRTIVALSRGADRKLRHSLNRLPLPVLRGLLDQWDWQAHAGQKEPSGDWTVWLLMAGRGFGKTRAGAEWVWARARETPNARIALVGGSRDEVAKVMIEGPSGLMTTARLNEAVEWKPTLGTVRFGSGALAFVYSAEAPEGLRGPEHHFAWADELAKWGRAGASTGSGRAANRKADAAWDNLMMGLRLGVQPRVMVTTTPRSVPLLRRVKALAGDAVTGGRSDENVHLPDAFLDWTRETYGDSRLGRQELGGELIEEVEGALFSRELMETSRVGPLPVPELTRIVVGVDPPASAGGTCGIAVCGCDCGGTLYVLADASVGGASPERWARAVAAAAEAWGADRVVAEKNQGGDMVESVLKNADVALPVKLVSASRGKVARAEPVAALFEAGRAKLAGAFAQLEDELAGLMVGGDYVGPGRSPDRADAMVWAMSALMRPRAAPRIKML